MINSDLNLILKSFNDWDKFASKTILVTGANGFLPAYMVETLMNLNEDILQNSPCKIIALVKNYKHAKIRFSNYINNKNFSLLNQDVSNKINIKKNIYTYCQMELFLNFLDTKKKYLVEF